LVSWGNDKFIEAYTYDTLMIDGDIFLMDLFNDIKSKGVEIVPL